MKRTLINLLFITMCSSSANNFFAVLQKPIEDLYKQFQKNPDNLTLKYQLGNALLNLGNRYFQENRPEDALTIFQELAIMFPLSYSVNHNLGYALAELNRPHEAIDSYIISLRHNPNNQETHVCLATAYLAINDYLQGFAEYEWRWKTCNNSLNKINIPIWHGESLQGKTIFLRSEGGLGGVLQFIRFANPLKKLGATIVVQTFSCLIPLLSLCPYIDHLISNHDAIPNADYQQSLMSLPFVLKTTYDNVPNDTYLTADQKLITDWKNYLNKNTFNIGICWQADPDNDANRPLLAQRSISLHLFEKLSHIPGIQLYSIQARDGIKQIENYTWIHTFGDDIDTTNGSFMDTAALMNHLDLIISVDTSVAHLAGALGKPVWLLLPYKSDWRWSWQSFCTSWYPSMQIFRSTEINSWDIVIEQVYQLLNHVIGESYKNI